MFATGYHTGMRLGEILNLTWDKVDVKAGLFRLDAADTKDREKRNVPISQELQEILASIPGGLYIKHVFLYKGEPVRCIKKTLKQACKEADIPYGRKVQGGFTFHDLRHTFNTNMRKAGVHESIIMKITGHASRDMFDRYNTIDADDGRLAMTQMRGYLQGFGEGVDQTVDQNQVSEQ